MKAFKVILLIVLLISIYTLFSVPLGNNEFPAWLNSDLVGFLLVIFIVTIFLLMFRR